MESLQESGEKKLKLSIFVCTKNRPEGISRLLESLASQKYDDIHSIIIVDGSSSEETHKVTHSSRIFEDKKTELIYLRTKGGKPSGLNLGLDYLENQLVKPDGILFLDDDIHFRISDFYSGLRFLIEKELCGLSPLIIDENTSVDVDAIVSKLPYKRNKEGKLTKSGNNVWVNMVFEEMEEWITTSWLPGGAVLYSQQKISGLRFSTELENPNLHGYALGDDVDFALRVNERGSIGVLRSIQVIHSSPLITPRNQEKLSRAKGKWKSHLVRSYPDRFSRAYVFGFEILRIVPRIVKSKNPFSPISDFLNFSKGYFGK